MALAAVSGLSAQDKATEEKLLISENAPEQETPLAEAPLVSTWDFVRMFLTLAAVVGAVYLLVFLLRRGMRRRLPDNDLIRVLGSKGLSGNRSLHLVEAGKSLYLIGSADGGISLIAEIKDPESVDRLRIDSAREAPPGGRRFSEILMRLIRPGRKEKPVVEESVDFLKKQRERLRNLNSPP